ncbi:MAG: RimK family protein [Planctomycetes bacterium]|nr:RimK family protein [Planctomycetota bacterium]NUQ35787.1 RimK family protein [Planctomycetaceae bacterium]
MPILLVVNDPKAWPLDIPGVEVVAARKYLTDSQYSDMRGAKVFNLCRHYRYQATGYYVTLLAEARGHRPQPDIATIQGFRSVSIAREMSEDLVDVIQSSLGPLRSKHFELSVYFGRNLAKRYSRLSLRLFNLFPVPLLRAYFIREDGKWLLHRVSPISASEIPIGHIPFLLEAAATYFSRRRWSVPKKKPPRYSMAILRNPEETHSPSNERAVQKFIKAASRVGIEAEVITKQDYGLLAEYDALFIRETTAVNHHTFRFAHRAQTLGLEVIDDPQSILRCTNKVFLAELLEHHGIPIPKTRIVHRENIDAVRQEIGLPCVLKQPDSSFSQGVVKVQNEQDYNDAIEKLLSRSDLVIAQEFLPTEYDWRIGVINGSPLWACRYYMADNHWQIIQQKGTEPIFGKVESLPIDQVPDKILKTAIDAATLIGKGLYGVDLKQSGNRCYVIEVNDNPNIDAGYEDKILGDELYRRIIAVFIERIERGKSWEPGI